MALVVPSALVRPLTAAILVSLLYLLHQDFWYWREARPLVFGFLPIGLFYHAAFTVACSIVMGALALYAWPAHLEDDTPELNPGPTPRTTSHPPDPKAGPTSTQRG